MGFTFRSPKGQVTLMGLIFLLNFTAFMVIQAYASNLYGEVMGANVNTAIYASFTLSCFVSPTVTNKLGTKLTMGLGILGYGALVVASVAYFLHETAALGGVVVAGGAVLGLGAALLWTAQGRLILQYSALHGSSGELLAIFWGIFNVSAILGGIMTFAYFSQSEDSGNVALYVVFLAFILSSAALCAAIVTPAALARDLDARAAEGDANRDVENEGMGPRDALLENPGPAGTAAPAPAPASESAGDSLQGGDEEFSSDSWSSELRSTWSLMKTTRMQLLALLFFQNGFCQPYQLTGFGDRFFDKRTLGLELCVFYGAEIFSAWIVGRLLDRQSRKAGPRTSLQLMLFFVVITMAANAVALVWESRGGPADEASITDVDVIAPTVLFFVWGFSDALLQTYVYWLLGHLFDTAKAQTRAVGTFKLLQSLGYTIGFIIVPGSRCAYEIQIALSSAALILGAAFATHKLAVPTVSPP